MREKYHFKMETLVWKEGICPPSLPPSAVMCKTHALREPVPPPPPLTTPAVAAAAVAAKSIHELVGRSVGRWESHEVALEVAEAAQFSSIGISFRARSDFIFLR